MIQFPYQHEPLAGPPPPSLSPQLVRWRPLIPVTIIVNSSQRFFPRALLDPGADDTVFPLSLAVSMGVALRGSSTHSLRWRGQSHPLRFGDVELELCDGQAAWRWSAIIGFSSAPIRYPILGYCGCLRHFDARFRGEDRIIELETTPSYPGTRG
ncbi:MAG: hypothetical protein FJ271_10995 [Planctomycetes bacterium]|nr:hypothetical protein [Planctomycetota bacterium]